jgi:hypothetical protein
MKIKLNLKLIACLASLNLTIPALALTDADIERLVKHDEELEKKIEELDQKVRILEREREIDQDSTAAIAKSSRKSSSAATVSS